jgi:hypothetical protein
MKQISKVMYLVSIFILCLSIPGYGTEKFNGYYKIIAKHSGKCLDIAGASVNDKANALLLLPRW